MKIIPSLLAENFEDFARRLRQAESFCDYVQMDLMDGTFVPTRSFPPEMINTVNSPLSFELHLMVEDPSSLLSKISNPGIRKFIFHFEAKDDHSSLIKRIKERGLDAGLAIKPQTAVNEFIKTAGLVDTLLFLTVNPGNYGSPFRADVLQKVAHARRIFPDKIISVDGGVSLDNLEMFYNIGVDAVCVGSRIFLHGNPAENYALFIRKVRELEGK